MHVVECGGHRIRIVGCDVLNEKHGSHPESGNTYFGVDMDLPRFNTGHYVIAAYDWNPDEPTCSENETLKEEGSSLALNDLVSMISLVKSQASRLVRVIFRTVQGMPTFKLDNDFVPVSPYPSISESALGELPHVSINSLTRIPDRLCAMCVDVVLVDDAPTLFAFKHYHEFPDSRFMYPLLDELKLLLGLNSPLIIKPTHIVIDAERGSDPVFRGFLMPFYANGSLKDMIKQQSQNRFGNDTALTYHLEWSLKERWAFQIASAVETLHQLSYSGTLSLDNILISETGDICLTGIGPQDRYTEPYYPFESMGLLVGPVVTRDVYALGIILWALAKEHFDLEQDLGCGSWEENDNAAPLWYRRLVEDCVKRNPNDRLSAESVAKTLRIQAGASISLNR